MIGRLITSALSPEIVHMVCKVYVPVLFPLTFLIAILALWMDGLLGWGGGFLSESTRWPIAIGTFVLGVALWLWTYSELVTQGRGSPSPTAGRTQQLVTSGIYAYSRNPSLFGKLLGVTAVGLALNSIFFCAVLVPLLLCGSLLEKIWRQEPQLVEVFGEEYVRYRSGVPLFLPWGLLFRSRRWGGGQQF